MATETVDVTAQLVAMIGDIVKKATATRPRGGVGGGSDDIIIEDGVTFDSGDLVIEFQNGRRLHCWNSEWGGVDTEVGDGPDALA